MKRLGKFAADEYAQSYSIGLEVQPQGFTHVAVVRDARDAYRNRTKCLRVCKQCLFEPV